MSLRRAPLAHLVPREEGMPMIPVAITYRTLRRAAMAIVGATVMLACAGTLVSSAAASMERHAREVGR